MRNTALEFSDRRSICARSRAISARRIFDAFPPTAADIHPLALGTVRGPVEYRIAVVIRVKSTRRPLRCPPQLPQNTTEFSRHFVGHNHMFVGRRINEFRPRQFKHSQVIRKQGFWAGLQRRSSTRSISAAPQPDCLQENGTAVLPRTVGQNFAVPSMPRKAPFLGNLPSL